MQPLVAEGVRKSYGDTIALRGVSLAVDAGEVLALVGPNGAGKTTLVRCLTGTTEPDAGEARLLGGPPRASDRARLGLLPQDFRPPGRLTARELLTYYAGLYDDARSPDAVLADVGLTAAADVRYANLSGGQQRRVSVGAAIVNEPSVLVLDEPTTGIDPAGRREVWSLVEALVAGGTTVLLTTHDTAEVERLADRVGVIEDGRLLAVASPRALIEEYGGEGRVIVETAADVQLDSYDVSRTEAGLVVDGVTADDLGGVVAALSDAGVDYGALSWREPDLERAYLSLVDGDGEPIADARVPGGAT